MATHFEATDGQGAEVPADAQSVLEVLSPVAEEYGEGTVDKAAPISTLAGQRIGLLWNGKANGDVALRRLQTLIEQHYSGASFRFFSGSMPCPREMLEEAAATCDVVIGCTADCGSCSSWMTHDCVELERRGIPTIIVASSGFEEDVKMSARAFALPDPRFVLAAKVYNNLSEAEAIEQTDAVFGELVRRLTGTSVGEEQTAAGAAPTLRYSGRNDFEALAAFQDDVLAHDWTDGYPCSPPTRDAVSRLLTGMAGDPDALVCILPPGNGRATLRNIAVNAAMAGCRPEEMPVIVAALRSVANMRPSARGPLMSTSPHAPLFLVNGPAGRELGINGGRCCVGPGRQNAVNIRIGRAILFCLKNIGSLYPGVMDMDSIGTTRKHLVVVAENEDESPWEPYHVSLGFEPQQSTVTVFFAQGEWDISLQGHLDAQQLASAIGAFSGGTSALGYFTTLGGEVEVHGGIGRLLLVPPPHAIPLATEAGFSKRSLAEFLTEAGREPIARLIEPVRKLYADGKIKDEWKWLFDLSEDEARRQTLPVIETPNSYSIVVVGAVRGKDILMPTRMKPHTEVISNTLG